MFKKIMSAILSLAMAASFSVCAFAENEPSDEASVAAPIEEEIQEQKPDASAIAIWGGTGACAVVIVALMIWKNKKDDFNWLATDNLFF